MSKLHELSYPDSMRILEESLDKTRAIRSLVEQMMYDNEKEATKAVNALLIEAAEKTGQSLYDICFHTIPKVKPVEISVKDRKDMCALGVDLNFRQEVRLEPVVFDLTHDGGYWKNKYFDLKKAMRELIDRNEEE